MLVASARMHLRRARAVRLEPEELVHEVWAIAIEKLDRIEARNGRCTPVLLTFLATTMQLRWKSLLREALKDPHRALATSMALPDDTAGVVTRALRDEQTRELLAAIDRLPAGDRELVVMRGIEQVPNHEVAIILGESPNTLAKRYGRALERLRNMMPGTVLDEL